MTHLEAACRKFAEARFDKVTAQTKRLEAERKAAWVEEHWRDYEDEMREALRMVPPQLPPPDNPEAA